MENILNIRTGLFLQSLLSTIISYTYIFVALVVLLIIGVVVLVVLLNKKHKESDYYKQTGKDLFDLDKDKGSSAEFVIGKRLERVSGYKKLIYNCYIPKTNGGTTEIDVILIHEKGLYVIESKNYSGWIFGNEDQDQWTQVLKAERYGSKKNYFYNPIKQNTTHVKWLEKYLTPLNYNIPIYSCIVFGNSCELKDVTVTSNQHAVMNEYYLFDVMQNHINGAYNVFNCEQVDEIYGKLFALTQVSEQQKFEHIQKVTLNKENKTSFSRNNFKNDYNSVSKSEQPKENTEQSQTTYDKKCPKCGATLVLRTVKSGERAGQTFWGCSNYPKCRHTENT